MEWSGTQRRFFGVCEKVHHSGVLAWETAAGPSAAAAGCGISSVPPVRLRFKERLFPRHLPPLRTIKQQIHVSKKTKTRHVRGARTARPPKFKAPTLWGKTIATEVEVHLCAFSAAASLLSSFTTAARASGLTPLSVSSRRRLRVLRSSPVSRMVEISCKTATRRNRTRRRGDATGVRLSAPKRRTFLFGPKQIV